MTRNPGVSSCFSPLFFQGYILNKFCFKAIRLLVLSRFCSMAEPLELRRIRYNDSKRGSEQLPTILGMLRDTTRKEWLPKETQNQTIIIIRYRRQARSLGAGQRFGGLQNGVSSLVWRCLQHTVGALIARTGFRGKLCWTQKRTALQHYVCIRPFFPRFWM